MTDADADLIADLRARIAVLERTLAELTARPKPDLAQLYPKQPHEL